jgi:hypothetical protein
VSVSAKPYLRASGSRLAKADVVKDGNSST